MGIKNAVHHLHVAPDQAGQRLDNYLRSRYKDLPKSLLYKIIRKGEVRVNKKRIDPDYRLQPEDDIRMPPLEREKKEAVSIKISAKKSTDLTQRILYEDKYILVLNKPSGLSVHAGSGVRVGLIETLRAMRPKDKFLELVHRIDRETSGCLLLAKKPSVLRECHELLREGKMTKKYILLVKGYWPAKLKYIEQALEGKPSKTLFQIKQRFAQATLLEAQPQTGRTHQIRIHAAQAGFPLVGDDKYGDKTFNKFMRAYGCDRLFLHAASLEFVLKLENQQPKKIIMEAPLEDDLQRCLKRLS